MTEKPYIIELPRITDPRGNLTFVQNGHEFMPFDIERAYWIYDVPAGEERGSHAHRRARSLMVAVSGSFDVELFDGHECATFTLNRPFQALYLPACYWRTIKNFSSGSVCLVLTSIPYSAEEYIRDFDEFIRLKNS